jgi:hypothetical protein
MGEVYLADHPRLPRHDALKVLPADVSADRSPACKPAIRFASFSGEADSGCWLIGRFVGRERRSHISSRADIGPVVVAQASARIPRMVGASADIQRDDTYRPWRIRADD